METSIIVDSTYSVNMEFVLSLLGILLGLSVIIILLEKRDNITESISKAITLIIWGISFITLATIWDLFFMYMTSAPSYFEDIHPLFIAIGMIFLIRAAQKFSSNNLPSKNN